MERKVLLQPSWYHLRESVEVNLKQILGYLNFPGKNRDPWYHFQIRTNPFDSVENGPITNLRSNISVGGSCELYQD